jgi:PAS domain S-box-containing protein
MLISPQNKNQESNQFETFFDFATIGIVITDRFGIITAINPYALKEFGYSKKEVIGKKIEILIPSRVHEKHSQYHQAYHEKLVTRMMGAGLDLVAQKKDGTEIAVEISLSNYALHEQKFVVAFINNISLRKKAEAKIEKLNSELEATIKLRTKDLEQALTQLQISQTRLENTASFQKAIVDNAGAMIIVTDKKGIINLFNPEASENTGYTVSEILHKQTPVLFHCKKEIEMKRVALVKQFGIHLKNDFSVLVEKARRNIHEEEQYTYIRKNGTSFPVSLTISSIKNASGEITGYMGVAIDISDRIKADEMLRKSLDKEKDLSELKSRFISMASHEFRTPLSTVLSSAYLIEKYTRTGEQPQREKHLKRIISSVSMLTDILNDFLSLGKIEEGKIPVRFTTFNISEAVKGIIEEIKGSFQKQQKIKYKHAGYSEVELDQSLLKHIILNLVSNASKFSPEKSTIDIKTINQEQSLVLAVKDRGIGICSEDQKHLKERFFRGSNAGNVQGTGLGLHIVSKYAELMNGSVVCRSELEKGSEFIITFQTKTNGHEKDTVDRR